MAVAFANPETTTGGNALKFYASMRLDVRRIGQVKAGENVVGNRTRVKVVKNKMAPPFGSCEFDIRYGMGIDGVADLLDLAAESGVIAKNGAYYSLGEESLGQGRERARATLMERADMREKIEAALPPLTQLPRSTRSPNRRRELPPQRLRPIAPGQSPKWLRRFVGAFARVDRKHQVVERGHVIAHVGRLGIHAANTITAAPCGLHATSVRFTEAAVLHIFEERTRRWRGIGLF